jgi:peptidyl-tRNA hydrolase, PTH1 family
MAGSTWLVVGLGNPGREYEWTPHNVGFLVLDRLAERHSIRIARPECQSQVGVGFAEGHQLILAKPQTYMNVSGAAVEQLLSKYELNVANLIVVFDELALEWGQLRIRQRGSAGGHNGMKSIIAAVRSEDFIRVRLGINPGKADGTGPVVLGEKTKHYVLAPLSKAVRAQLDPWLDEASLAVETIISGGVEKAMAQFNRRAPASKEEEA